METFPLFWLHNYN